LSLGYVGSVGHRLLRREMGGIGSDAPSIYYLLVTNRGASNYHGLEFQYRRRVTHGLQAITAYAWSHSIDNGSSDSFLFWAGTQASDRGSSDFDLRHSFTGTVTYEFGGWGADAVVHARSGFPISVLNSEEFLGINLANAFRPDLVYGQPLWLNSRVLNPAAFQSNPVPPTGLAPPQGTLGRNAIQGFGMWQADLALRREFRWTEQRRFEIRVEAYNLFNHPNFADPVRFLDSPIFGQSISMLNLMLGTGSPGSGLSPILQTGGPRTFQATLRFRF